MDGKPDKFSRWSTVVLAVVLAVGAVFALFSIDRAAQERAAAVMAMDLRMAATAVANADTVASLGGDLDSAALGRALAVLAADTGPTLDALSPRDAQRADELIDRLLDRGNNLSRPEVEIDAPLNGEARAELGALLTTASDVAADRAVAAENRALGAVASALVATVLAGWLAAGSRFRSARDRSMAEAQREETERLQSLLDDSPDSRLLIAPDDTVGYRSASTASTFCHVRTLDDLVELATFADRSTFRSHLEHAGSERTTATFQLEPPTGSAGWFEISVSNLDAPVDGRLVTARDVTAETELRRELEVLATTDPLTGVLNRRMLKPQLTAALDALGDGDDRAALLTIDIDNFKAINDTLGHPIGDRILIETAKRLVHSVRESETLIRMGGDEFALLVPRIDAANDVDAIVHRLHTAFFEPLSIDEHRNEPVRLSIGAAVAGAGARADDLTRDADIALYEAKRRGGDAAVVFEPSLAESLTRRQRIERTLRDADHDAEFSLVFQPIVRAATTEVTSLEALLRWQSPELGRVGPDEFIPIAESTGEICAIGRWVMDRVCQQLATWIGSGVDPNLTVSFNVSAMQLADDRFVGDVLAAAAKWKIPTNRLVVEVTETAALDPNGVARGRILELRDAGFRVSIDDFGAGYSNLGQLISIPFDIIKIDRSLLLTLSEMRMQAGGDPSEPCAIMQAIVSIAGILEAPVVCEGVETEEQRRSLVASGITHVQGYLTGRPVPADELEILPVPTA